MPNLVWLKRDLRLRDHAPFRAAVEAAQPFVAAYWFEPSVMAAPEHDERHWRFVRQSLCDIDRQLAAHGGRVWVFRGEVVDGLAALHQAFGLENIFSHQEIGLKTTFERDRAVAAWCRSNDVAWHEFDQDAVRRAARDRRGWSERVDAHFGAPPVQTNWARAIFAELPPGLPTEPPTGEDLPLGDFQPGGETVAWRYLQSFVRERGRDFRVHISKPALSRRSCSRLSPYIAWGCLSAREAWQWGRRAAEQPGWEAAMREFCARIVWRSHFMQKFESLDRMEFEPPNPGFAALRRYGQHFEAWAAGRTGFPMVDASMRCLRATGYLNFRMRAMLVTFATFTLWLDWKRVATELARLFLDFEPGIHFSQIHMQSGQNGYNTLRIYNPTEQCLKHDPDGQFLRTWLPELAAVPVPLLFEPWKLTPLEQAMYGVAIGRDYPAPVVDFEAATRQAKNAYWEIRQGQAVQEALPALLRRLAVPRASKLYQDGTLR